jgi:hypothetical protein
MKKLILIFLFVASVASAQMTIAGNHRKIWPSSGGVISPVGTPACASSASASPVTVPYIKVASGDVLIVGLIVNASGVPTVSISDGGSTYVNLVHIQRSTTYTTTILGTTSLASGAGNVVVSYTGVSGPGTACVQEFSYTGGAFDFGNTNAVAAAASTSYTGGVPIHSETGNYAVAAIGVWASGITYTATTGAILKQKTDTTSSTTLALQGIAGPAGGTATLSGTSSVSASYAMALVELRAH